MADPKKQQGPVDPFYPSVVVGEPEYEIEDKGPEREKPAFVVEDDAGWLPVGGGD